MPIATPSLPSATLAAIRRRGVLLAGVRADDAPMSARGADGSIRGFEPDLAADLARRLGVRLRLVPVTQVDRLQKLEEGAVDLVIASLANTPERRRVATLVEPDYGGGGVGVMLRRGVHVTDWVQLRGQTVCGTRGSSYNRPMAQLYLLTLSVYGNARDAGMALRDGRCIGWLAHDSNLRAQLQSGAWEAYHAPLQPALVTPWSIALSRGEAGTDLERFVGDTVAQWHRSGFILEREQAWGLPPSGHARDAHALWSRRDAAGQWECARDAHGDWPTRCRNRDLLTAFDATGLHLFGLALRDLSGWDLTYLYDPYDRDHMLAGLGWTVLLMTACVVGSLLLGVAGALLAQGRLRLLAWGARAAAAWARMTPPLLQMQLLFFGAGAVAWSLWGTSLPAFAVATVCLSAYTGASVMSALLDAATARAEVQPGFRLRWDTLGAAYAGAAGSITASLVNVTKATMMASAIAVPELLASATDVLTHSGNAAEVMNLLMFLFLVLGGIAVRLLAGLEFLLLRRWQWPRWAGRARGAGP